MRVYTPIMHSDTFYARTHTHTHTDTQRHTHTHTRGSKTTNKHANVHTPQQKPNTLWFPSYRQTVLTRSVTLSQLWSCFMLHLAPVPPSQWLSGSVSCHVKTIHRNTVNIRRFISMQSFSRCLHPKVRDSEL